MPQGAVDRKVVDEAMLSELSKRYLDLDAMRERQRASHDSAAALAADALDDAEHEIARIDSDITRVRGDYMRGAITPEEWHDLRDELKVGLETAKVERGRLRDQLARLEKARGIDAEATVLRQLAELRAAILAGVADAPNLNSLRRLLHHPFTSVTYLPAELVRTDAEPDMPGAYLGLQMAEEW